MAKGVNPLRQTRRERKAATRGRIVRAATEVFTDAGYVGARMSDIADRAGVAVQTVYFTFHTKPELLQACFDDAVLGPERRPPLEQEFYRDLMSARSGRSALAAFVRGNTAILRRAAAIQQVAASASHEPDAVAVVAHSEKLRRDGLGKIVEGIGERHGLRVGLTPGEATDVLLVMSSPATYLTLRGYGWSDADYEEWLADTLATQLLSRPGRRSGG